MGYRVLEKGLPVEIADIKGEVLRSRIGNNGCCGAWELLKLYAWTLTEYHVVVHVDMDVAILQNLDELFDDWPPELRAMYTYDWTMARPPWGSNPPVQGGFLVAKPDLDVFNRLVDVVRVGDFRSGKGGRGWGGTGAGTYWGGMTIQGLIPYFFDYLHPHLGKAVDNCVYNNMANNPRSVGGFDKGDCRDGTTDCKDCRLVPLDTVKTVHFTICQKPWTCVSASHLGCPYCPICAKFHAQWFELRAEMEREWGLDVQALYTGDAAQRHGMCGRRTGGGKGYTPVPIDLLLRNTSLAARWRASWGS